MKAYQHFSKSCNVSLALIEQYHANGTSLKPYPSATPRQSFSKWPVSEAFKPSDTECRNAVIAYRNNLLVKSRAATAAGICLAYWAFVLLLRAIAHWSDLMFPTLTQAFSNTVISRAWRRAVTLPALFKRRHSMVINVTRFFTLNLPKRQDSLIILGFLFVHLSFLFGWNPIHDPSYIRAFDYRQEWGSAVGYRAGEIACMELPLLIIFAGRNNFLQWVLGWSQDTFVVFHKWIGRAVGFSILMHAAAYIVRYVAQGSPEDRWVPYWKWGVAAGTFMGLMVLLGTHALRRLSYEVFLVFHIALGVGVFVTAHWHVWNAHGELRWFYACWAIWGFDRLMRVGRIFYSGFWACAEVVCHRDNMLEFTIEYPQRWTPMPGNYVFLHVVQPAFFWESHPFTLNRGCTSIENGRLKVFSRVKSGMTDRTMKLVKANGGSHKMYVWLDGPYGPSIDFTSFKEALFISGGVGITASFAYVHGILESSKPTVERIRLHWAIADFGALEWFQDELNYLRESERVEVNIYIGGRGNVDPVSEQKERAKLETSSSASSSVGFVTTNKLSLEAGYDKQVYSEKEVSINSSSATKSCILNGRIKIMRGIFDAKQAVREAILQTEGPLAAFCCGPPGINDNVRKTVTDSLVCTTHYVQYFEDSFSW